MAEKQLNDWNYSWINGAKVYSEHTFDVFNPATGDVVGRVPNGGVDLTKSAVDAAYAAFAEWSKTTPKERAAYLLEWAKRILQDSERLAALLSAEQGKPLWEARGEVEGSVDLIYWYAEEAKRAYGEIIPASRRKQRLMVFREPIGVVGLITPMNVPAGTLLRKVAPALAAGCTVVLKPAEKTPLIALALFEHLQDTGLPAGVANLVTGDPAVIAETLLTDPRVRKLSFTGSSAVGKLLMRQGADQVKRLSLELGGICPVLVFPDADLQKAADEIIGNKFENCGQVCNGINLVYAHETIAAELTALLVERVQQIKVAPGTDPQAQIGPLISHAARDRIERLVADAKEKGAAVLTGGERLAGGMYENGSFYAPTVLANVNNDMLVSTTEIFGPVLPILTFSEQDEVVKRCNSTPYGLAAYVYTKDSARMFELIDRLEFGMVGVNGTSLAYTQAPFGGVKESGIGREGGHHGLEEFLELKYAAMTIE